MAREKSDRSYSYQSASSSHTAASSGSAAVVSAEKRKSSAYSMAFALSVARFSRRDCRRSRRRPGCPTAPSGCRSAPWPRGSGRPAGPADGSYSSKNRHRSCCMELSAPTGRNRPAAPRSPPPVRIRNPTDRTEGFRTAKVEIFCPTAKITRNICRPKWARTAIQERFSSFCARFSPGLRTFSSAVLHPVARRELQPFPQHHLNNKKGAITRSLLFFVSNVPPRKASPEEGYQYSSSLKKKSSFDG